MAEIADRTGFELTAWMGERACSEGKRAILEWLARTARRFRPSLHADCEVIIYVLTKP